ncbi:MAG TPA: DUF1810 domain-containing protein [Candidatus Blautia intestinipullorum]|nr:DUF1810 domain-containing protein [Candidatus Blautia intestinipullorum]
MSDLFYKSALRGGRKVSDLQRFIDAQNYNYQSALEEIKNGRKTSCWMWYVFPQICGLGYSQMR